MIIVNNQELIEGHPRFEEFQKQKEKLYKDYSQKGRDFSVTFRMLKHHSYEVPFKLRKDDQTSIKRTYFSQHQIDCYANVQTTSGLEKWEYSTGEQLSNGNYKFHQFIVDSKGKFIITDIDLIAFLVYKHPAFFDKHGSKEQKSIAGKLFEIENHLRDLTEKADNKSKQVQVDYYLWSNKLTDDDLRTIAMAMGMNKTEGKERVRVQDWIHKEIEGLNFKDKDNSWEGCKLFLDYVNFVEREKVSGHMDEGFEMTVIVQTLMDKDIIRFMPEDSQWAILCDGVKKETIGRKMRPNEIDRRGVLLDSIYRDPTDKKTILWLWEGVKPEKESREIPSKKVEEKKEEAFVVETSAAVNPADEIAPEFIVTPPKRNTNFHKK